MDTKIYHGEVKALDLAEVLVGRFNRGNMKAQAVKSGDQYVVQIASRRDARSGGQTALGLTLQQMKDGVAVRLGKQTWLGIAASLGVSVLMAKANPLNLLGRLDDLAQDIENLTLDDRVWEVIDEVAETMGASQQLTERLRRTGCAYCGTANPVGQPRCLACGAPLGDAQPRSCEHCGFVASPEDAVCQNCGDKL